MRAAVVTKFGGPEVLEISDVPEPAPVFTEVSVKVYAAGINPIDSKTREGKGVAAVVGSPPFSAGWDVAGIVEHVPFGVNALQKGDRVLGLPRFPHQAGTFAEFVAGPVRHFARIPDSMDFATAAALPLAGSTAWQIVHEAARIAPGQRVLIHGAGGGVGHLAVQICKAHGAFVIASASDSKHEYLRSLHVDQLIDYQKTRFEDSLDGKVDAVIDLIGGEISYRSLSVLHTGGVIVSVPSGQNPGIHHAAADLGLRAADIIVDTYRPTLESLVSLWEQGKLAVEVAETYDLSNVVAAHRAAENNRRPGKIVLTVAHEEKTTDTSERHFNLDG